MKKGSKGTKKDVKKAEESKVENDATKSTKADDADPGKITPESGKAMKLSDGKKSARGRGRPSKASTMTYGAGIDEHLGELDIDEESRSPEKKNPDEGDEEFKANSGGSSTSKKTGE